MLRNGVDPAKGPCFQDFGSREKGVYLTDDFSAAVNWCQKRIPEWNQAAIVHFAILNDIYEGHALGSNQHIDLCRDGSDWRCFVWSCRNKENFIHESETAFGPICANPREPENDLVELESWNQLALFKGDIVLQFTTSIFGIHFFVEEQD